MYFKVRIIWGKYYGLEIKNNMYLMIMSELKYHFMVIQEIRDNIIIISRFFSIPKYKRMT